MENPFFVMTLSGTLGFLLYKIIYPFARKHVQAKWRYTFLKIVLLFYLMPIPLLLYWIRGAIKNLIQLNRGNANLMIPVEKFAETIAVSTNSVVNSPYFTILLYVSICLGAVSFFLLCFQMINYIREKRECLQSGFDLPQEQFQKEAAAVRLKQQVRFLASPKAKSPFVIGVHKPAIVLPAKMLDADQQTISMCIRHELAHIKKGDLIFRLLALTAVCVHWYNPICHAFRKELMIISEICCDYEVVQTIHKSQRKLYYNTLISVTESIQPKITDKFLSTFANENHIELKRRILELEVIDISKRKWLAALFFAAVFLAGFVGALPYTPYPMPDPVLNLNNSLTVFDPDVSSIDDFPQHPQSGSVQDPNGSLTILNPDVLPVGEYSPPNSTSAMEDSELGLNNTPSILESDVPSIDAYDFPQASPDFGQENSGLDPNSVLAVPDQNFQMIDNFPIPSNSAHTSSEQDSSNSLTMYESDGPSTATTLLPLPFVRYFTDKSGTIYEAIQEQGDQNCSHEFDSGTIVEHIRSSESNCIMAYYQGKRCVNCGYLEQGICVFQSDSKGCNHTFIDMREGE